MATKSYPVNGRDTTYQQWNRIGVSPYLDDEDYPNDYIITTYTTAKYEGDFFFADSGSENELTLTAVKLRIKGRRFVTDPEMPPQTRFDLYDGSAWKGFEDFTLPDSLGFVEIDVSAFIDSWSKLDACKLRLYGRMFISGQQALIDYAELQATYTEEGESQPMIVQVI